MQNNSNDYYKIRKAINEIIVDYGINHYPLDLKGLCEKLAIRLIKYSNYSGEDFDVLMKKSKKGFNVKELRLIYYNDVKDENNSVYVICYTIAHEILHIEIEDDTLSENESLMEFGARYLLCPTPYLVIMQPKNSKEIASKFKISKKAAAYAYDNYESRTNKFGNLVFNYEIEMIKTIMGDEFDKNDFIENEKGYIYTKIKK